MSRIAKIVGITLVVSWVVYAIGIEIAGSVQVINLKGDLCTYNVVNDVFANNQLCDDSNGGVYWEARASVNQTN